MSITTQSIQNSVGRGGVNRWADTCVVQELLNGHIDAGRLNADRLVKDGDCGGLTIGAIRAFQTGPMSKSESWADGRVDPNGQTWKALNGNLPDTSAIPPMEATPQVEDAVHNAASNAGYAVFRQGDYGQNLGNGSKTIAAKGCCLCTLTMAATVIGSRTKHWPADLAPKDLDPLKANDICKKAGAFGAGKYTINMSTAVPALGMKGEHYGFDSNNGNKLALPSNAIDVLTAHLATGNPVAANVDYKDSSDMNDEYGDHWVLITSLVNEGIAHCEALDPSPGDRMTFTKLCLPIHERHYDADRALEAVLFGIPGDQPGTSYDRQQKQFNYGVLRFMTLEPA